MEAKEFEYFDVEPIREEMRSRGHVIKKCPFQARKERILAFTLHPI